MSRTSFGLGLATFALYAVSCLAAEAACEVVGDSVGVGVGLALKGTCLSNSKVGRSSSNVAALVHGGGHWSIVSLGSNDFPRGIAPKLRAQSEGRVRAALQRVADRAEGRLILIIPANGARAIVADWASAHGVQRTVTFAAGSDGIHPSNYAALAQDIRRKMN